MKKILLSVFALAVMGITARVHGQCDLFPNNLVVNLSSAVLNGGNCNVTATIEFDILHNDGNKRIWINLWKTADYNALPVTSGHPSYLEDDMPTLDDLNGASNANAPVAVIGINNAVSPAVYFTTYSADPSNITPSVGSSITITAGPLVNGQPTDHVTLTGVTFTSPGLCAGLILQGDIWSTQAAGNSPTIHCFAPGISFFGDPTISGLKSCTTPRTAIVILNSVSTLPLTVNFTIFLDQGPAGWDGSDPVAYGPSANIALSSSTPYNSGPLNYTGNGSIPQANQNLIVRLTVVAPFSKTIDGLLTNSCFALPVKLTTFTADRIAANVNLRWQTSTEVNSAGFAVERNTNGVWQDVAFVPTQAPGGNSSEILTYSYVDLNNVKGVSQYRIRQVDHDGSAKYSEIRSVRGLGQTLSTIVYPNPSVDGKINIVFNEGVANRTVTVADLNGRVLKQMNSVSNNNITIENLQPGVYTVRVFVPATGEVSVQKVIVSQR